MPLSQAAERCMYILMVRLLLFEPGVYVQIWEERKFVHPLNTL